MASAKSRGSVKLLSVKNVKAFVGESPFLWPPFLILNRSISSPNGSDIKVDAGRA